MKSTLLIFSILTSSFLFAQDKQMVFQSKKDSTRIFSIRLADASMLKMKDGKKKIGLICSYTDSTICFKENRIKENQAAIKAIGKDKSLSREQKQASILKAIYPDSVAIPYNSIKKIEFSLGGDKKYRLQKLSAGALMVSADLLLLSSVSINESYYSSHDAIPPPYIATRQGMDIGLLAAFGSIALYYEACIKTIYTRNWKLKN